VITFKELNPKGHIVPKELLPNMSALWGAMNTLRFYYNEPMLVTSGYRTPIEQRRINPSAPNSAHTVFQAVDVYDPDKYLWNWCIENLENYVIPLGLYLEEKLYTPKHVHFQTRAPSSGNRIFRP